MEKRHFTPGFMVRFLPIAILAAALTGCAGKSYKVDHPVVGPAPPRVGRSTAVAMVDDASENARGQSANVELASGSDAKSRPLEMTDVVATVNGTPILVSTVVGTARVPMEAARSKIKPAEYRMAQEQLIKAQLPGYVEEAMMYSAMQQKLKPDMQKGIDTQVDTAFAQQLESERAKLQKQEDAQAAKQNRKPKEITLVDLEAQMQAQGMSIPQMRKRFGEQMIAHEYVRAKLEGGQTISRQELLEAYHERKLEFTEPAQVKWQQIQITYKNFGSKAEARVQAEAAMSELRRGVAFGDVAKKYSDGPDAANGGAWDWTQFDSVFDELRDPLKTLPRLTPSSIIETPKSLQIVQVIDRHDERVKPFEEVQKKIQDDIADFKHKVRVREILDELKAQSVVWTIFDEPEGAPPATPAAETPAPKPKSTKL